MLHKCHAIRRHCIHRTKSLKLFKNHPYHWHFIHELSEALFIVLYLFLMTFSNPNPDIWENTENTNRVVFVWVASSFMPYPYPGILISWEMISRAVIGWIQCLRIRTVTVTPYRRFPLIRKRLYYPKYWLYVTCCPCHGLVVPSLRFVSMAVNYSRKRFSFPQSVISRVLRL